MWAKAQYNLCKGFRLFNLEERNGTQNTFLYGVTPSVFKGLQRRATVYFPIWWGEAPRIVSTFMESYDFSGKTIVPFCTSGGSGMGSSAAVLEKLTSGARWLEGRRLNGSDSQDTVMKWVNSLGLDFGE